MLLALVAPPILAIGALLALTAIAPPQPRHSYTLPAIHTVALVTLATIYVALVWSH
ncbi:hypothetical protein [Streptomyces sp. NPDC093093]|uniref:hypothetical protein n=1 Tax=Streptomyces sp. NPDC093093 TaxID=3366025 RepID=UPI003817BBAE